MRRGWLVMNDGLAQEMGKSVFASAIAGRASTILLCRPREGEDPVTPVFPHRERRDYWMPAGACHRAALCADPLAGMTAIVTTATPARPSADGGRRARR